MLDADEFSLCGGDGKYGDVVTNLYDGSVMGGDYFRRYFVSGVQMLLVGTLAPLHQRLAVVSMGICIISALLR